MRACTLAVVALLAGVVASCDEVGTATQPETPAPTEVITVSAEAVVLDLQQRGVVGTEAPIRDLEVAVSLPGIPGPAVAAADGPEGGFPLVFVNGAPGTTPQGAMTDNVADAVARVAPGGTIRIFPGTYLTEDVVVDKPVTIEPQPHGGTTPVLLNESASASLVVRDLASGTVVIRGLEFRNESPAIVEGNTALRLTAGVLATADYDAVRIEGSRFETAFDGLAGVISFLPSNPASSVTVTESSFRGGFVGTFATGSPSFEVRESDFEGHRILAASFNTSGGGVSGSEFTDCGGSTCITSFDGSDVVHEGNELTNCSAGTCMNVAQVGTRGVIRGNRFVESQDGAGDFHQTLRFVGGAEGHADGNVFEGCGSGTCVFISDADVEIERSEFHLTTDGVEASGVTGLGSGGGIVVRTSAFFGGRIGIASDGPGWLVEGNVFSDQTRHVLRFGGEEAGGIFRDNDISCGTIETCLSFLPSGNVEVLNNRVTADISSRQENLLEVNTAVTARIIGNEVRGTGGARNPADRSTWPIGNAIGFGQLDFVEVSGNLVDGAEFGMAIGAVDELVGLDNTITNVSAGLNILEGAVGSIRSSDVTNYEAAFNVFGTQIDLTCNWWGSAAGPQNPNAPAPSVYTPWATAPVAGTSTTNCSGGL